MSLANIQIVSNFANFLNLAKKKKQWEICLLFGDWLIFLLLAVCTVVRMNNKAMIALIVNRLFRYTLFSSSSEYGL